MATQTFTVQVAQRGSITLPQTVRRQYNIEPGQQMTLVDLGGVFVLSPRKSQIDATADRIARELTEQGESHESMLQALRDLRAESA
jgi:bifunctional DNA-binding transcriptional regulator/antitoxin component of YhaV-PrlF toxin-antitoxin module